MESEDPDRIFPHPQFLYPALDTHREIIDKHHLSWGLEVGNFILTEIPDLLFGQHMSFLYFHPCTEGVLPVIFDPVPGKITTNPDVPVTRIPHSLRRSGHLIGQVFVHYRPYIAGIFHSCLLKGKLLN